MSRNLVAAMLAVLIITALTGLVPAQEPTTQPAAPPKPAAKWPHFATDDWARWGCVFAGLALVGVLWVGWSMRTLARNQVELARMVQALRAQKGG